MWLGGDDSNGLNVWNDLSTLLPVHESAFLEFLAQAHVDDIFGFQLCSFGIKPC